MSRRAKVLLVEDDPGISATLERVMIEEGYEFLREGRGDEGLSRATREQFDVVITDLRLPGLGGMELVQQLRAAQPRLPIILITAHGTTETAIRAMKAGAYDYLVKPFEMAELLDLVSKASKASRLMSEPVGIGQGKGDSIVGTSRAMQTIYKEIGRVATKPVNVLIRGETGTGKELIARAIYQHSERSTAPFIAVNCAAIPETLLESELFGYERGAFTGAENRRIGRFEQAHMGTIFLDEIGDMTPGTQAKLLRVLQEKTLQRLGGKELIPVDARVLAATHCNLEVAMQEKQFREDLFYRLSVVTLRVPALRERAEDIPDLLNFFLNKYGQELKVTNAGIDAEALRVLQEYSWPGNVRELENIARKLLLQARGYRINVEHVREVIAELSSEASEPESSMRKIAAKLLDAAMQGQLSDSHGRMIEIAERELIAQAIQRANGNQAKAARWLGLSRLTLREKLLHYHLHPKG
jgi:DNA-binding NtrC family response regulator